MKNTEQFIKDAREVHGDKYDYSKVEYVNSKAKVCIICPIHGEFWQTPNNHLRGNNCPLCRNEKLSKKFSLTKEKFIGLAKEVHGDKYDYSKVEYINTHTKVCIICPIHGEFWQTPAMHLKGQGCRKCSGKKQSLKQTMSREEFINKAKSIHGDKYDYSKVDYIDSRAKVCIICSKHGEFWQRPSDHLKGCGCPHCKESKLEYDIKLFLQENKIIFEEQKTFYWLKRKKHLYLDFYLPKYNIAIECQGGQHFKSVKRFGGNDKFEERKILDKLKYDLCKKNSINILYYTNETTYGKMFNENIIHNNNDLIKIINNGN